MNSGTVSRTALHDVHAALGATFTDFAGWAMPLRYTSEVAEHHAVRSGAGIFDLSHMGEIEVSGTGAAAGLDAALVSDIGKIPLGRAKYTMICAEDGGIIDDLVVYRVGEFDYLVVANAANAGTVLGHLRERIVDGEARVHDASPDWSLIAVQGPASAAIAAAATGSDVSRLKYYAIQPARIADHDVRLARTGYTGEDGFEIYCRPEHAPAVWAAVSDAGRADGLQPAGLASRDSLRLEAGMPLYGQELSLELTPFEAGLGRVVALDKGVAFVGQQALRERSRRGPLATLVGLNSAGRRSPRSGYAVTDADSRQPIGQVTSGIPSPTLGHPIAMAYVPERYAAPGTAVLVDVRGALEPHTVTGLPFYRRPR
jgi:aminomethyltransferase